MITLNTKVSLASYGVMLACFGIYAPHNLPLGYSSWQHPAIQSHLSEDCSLALQACKHTS